MLGNGSTNGALTVPPREIEGPKKGELSTVGPKKANRPKDF